MFAYFYFCNQSTDISWFWQPKLFILNTVESGRILCDQFYISQMRHLFEFNNWSPIRDILQLVHTLLNYATCSSNVGTSTVAIFLSNDHSLYAPIYLGWTSCLISFVWHQSSCQERVESNKMQNEKILPTCGFEPTTIESEFWCSTNLANRVLMKVAIFKCFFIYKHVLPIPM